ncbi:hypothetical protein ABFA25_00695 [Mycobacterium lepromatosis]|nr:hypothetical protein [Mycobacterium lepromatosis]
MQSEATKRGGAAVTLTGRTGLIALACILPIALSLWPAKPLLVPLALLSTDVIGAIG